MALDQVEQVTQSIKRYALAEDPNEKGAEIHRVEVEPIDPLKVRLLATSPNTFQEISMASMSVQIFMVKTR